MFNIQRKQTLATKKMQLKRSKNQLFYNITNSFQLNFKKLGLLIYKWRRYVFKFSTIKKTSYRSLSYKNIQKDKMTARVDIIWRIFQKIYKKDIIEVTGLKIAQLFNVFRVIYQKLCFSGPVTSFLIFNFALKDAPQDKTLTVISGQLD